MTTGLASGVSRALMAAALLTAPGLASAQIGTYPQRRQVTSPSGSVDITPKVQGCELCGVETGFDFVGPYSVVGSIDGGAVSEVNPHGRGDLLARAP